MWQKGSITVFYSLILSLIISLISTLLLSSKVTAGRAQIAMAMDQAMYSTMAKYDADLLKEYHLFFLDAGYGSETLQLGKILDELESDLSYVLMPAKGKGIWGSIDFLKLSLKNSSITGYTLATDNNGSVFREQVVQYMKDTMLLQGISDLTDNLLKQNQIFGDQENEVSILENITEGFTADSLESSQNVESNTGSEISPPSLSQEESIKIEDTKKVLKNVEKLKKSSILNLVVENPEGLSAWEMDEATYVSNRDCQSGMGVIEKVEEAQSITSNYLFQEYLLRNINYYGNSYRNIGPAYGVEYILQGKSSDVENLEGVVKKLLLMREAANAAYLYTNTEKRASAQSVAMLIATAIFLPELEAAIEAAIILAWAYVESIVDVCGLLSGKSVPFVKNSSSWQVSFGNLVTALGNPHTYCKSSGSNDYKDYLSLMLYTKSESIKTMRCMDVIELSMRAISGKEGFSMDCAIDTLEVNCSVLSEGKKCFEIIERRCYRNM